MKYIWKLSDRPLVIVQYLVTCYSLLVTRYLSYDRLALGFCSLVLIIALVIGHFHQVGTFGVETDFYGVYAVQAENIMAGKLYTYQHNPPGYCLLLAVVSYLTGNTFVAGKVISAFATALFGWISYLLIKVLFDSSIALATTIFLLLFLIPYSFVAATDVVGALAIIIPLWILLRDRVLTFKSCFFSGIFAGIAYLIRANAIFVSVGIALALIFINLDRETLHKRFHKLIVFSAGILLVTLPWFIYNWKVNGSPLSSTAYFQIAAHFYHPQGDEYVTSWMEMSIKFHSLSEILLYDPFRLLSQYIPDVLFFNIRDLLIPSFVRDAFKFPTYLLVMALPLSLIITGFLLLIRDLFQKVGEYSKIRLTKKRYIFLLVYLLGYLILGLVGFRLRYYLFLFPLVFLLNVYPLFYKQSVTKKGSIEFRKFSLTWLLVIILSLPLAGSAYLGSRSILASEPRYLLEIAEFLKQYSSVDRDRITIARKPHLAYLAGFKAEFPLAKTADEYLVKAKEINASYIVYSDYEAELWPGLKALSNPQAISKHFKLIYQDRSSNTLVYKIIS
jgi:4-amino-4-deoxy-L-arabinose transferase-like glycosyltransferase